MNASATALSKPTMKALRLMSDWDDFPLLRPVVPDGSLRCGSNVPRELFLLCIRSLTRLVFCWCLPLAESLGVIHSSDGASELTRERLLRPRVGLVDGSACESRSR